MNTISTALTQAGVKLPPLRKRVWQVLHDSKIPRSSKAISEIINAPHNDVASALSGMCSRGMVIVSHKERVRIKGPKNSTINRQIAQYSTVGQKYELLPVVPRPKAAPPAKPDVEQRFLRSPPQPVTPVAIDIEKMTLAQAHALYKRLQEFFS